MKVPGKFLYAVLAAQLLQNGEPASAAGGATTASAAVAPSNRPLMPLQSSYPVIVTDKLVECRDFYVRWLGFEVVFDSTWFVYLSAGVHGIAFMSPDHPSQPPGPERFSGQGMFLTLQVEDAAGHLARLTQAGVPIAYPLQDEKWGQRRFGLHDPSGMWVDVVQQIEPAAGYWDKYLRP